MVKRFVIGLGVFLAFILVAGVLAGDPPASQEDRPQTASGTAPSAPAPTEVVQPAPEPIVLSGTGQSLVDIQLTKGLARISMSHSGAGHFAVLLLTDDGQRASSARAASDTLLANDIGAWSGEKAVRVERAGAFLLEVSASGPWEITITN